MNAKSKREPMQLLREFATLRATAPRMRAYDAAQTLGVSECELVAASVGDTATRLRVDVAELLPAMGQLGTVMGLTRNPHAVIEKHGRYRNIEMGGHAGTVQDEGLDLRVFPAHWVHAYAVQDGERSSLQFFDASGVAVHKTFLIESSDAGAYQTLCTAFAVQDQSPGELVEERPAPARVRPDRDVDTELLRRRWSELRDTHDFFYLLKELDVDRTQAMRLAGHDWARPVDRLSARPMLAWAATSGVPIMAFVGNRGNIEIHTGPVHTVKQVGEWFNVLDPGFNLHLHEPGIAAAWVVRKPTDDGIVTSLELYAADGLQITSFFGKRKPGHPELTEWRAAVADLPTLTDCES